MRVLLVSHEASRSGAPKVAALVARSLVGQGPKDDPADVAEQGFAALMAGERKVVAASLAVKAMEAANKVLPDAVKAMSNRVFAKPRE